MLIQSNQNCSTQAFGAKLKFSKPAERAVKNAITVHHKALRDLAPEKFPTVPSASRQLRNLQRAFAEITANIPGKVTYSLADKKGWMNLTYKDGRGFEAKGTSSDLFGISHFLPSAMFDNGKPYINATRHVVAEASDATAHAGKGYGKENPFHVLFRSISLLNSNDLLQK